MQNPTNQLVIVSSLVLVLKDSSPVDWLNLEPFRLSAFSCSVHTLNNTPNFLVKLTDLTLCSVVTCTYYCLCALFNKENLKF